MIITTISKSDLRGGGASRVAYNLTKLLRESGIKTNHLAATNAEGYSDIRGDGIKRKIYRASKVFSKIIGYPDFYSTEIFNIDKHILKGTDIFHIHDISDAFSPITIKQLRKHGPIVWTFHDCSPFTGGCIQPMECSAYIMGCKNCPALREWPMGTSIDMTRSIQNYKLKLLNEHIDKIICPSTWIADLASTAGIDKKKISIIQNSTDVDIYKPTKSAKIDKNRLTILVYSMEIYNKYKGAELAKEIINNLPISIKLIIAGRDSSKFAALINPKHEIEIHDATFDQQKIVEIYGKSDLLLYPSLADNCPLTIIESLSCGVPVISYETGGIPEIITHEVCGYTLPKKDITTAIKLIVHLNSNRGELEQLSKNARLHAIQNFSNERFFLKHIKIYNELLSV